MMYEKGSFAHGICKINLIFNSRHAASKRNFLHTGVNVTSKKIQNQVFFVCNNQNFDFSHESRLFSRLIIIDGKSRIIGLNSIDAFMGKKLKYFKAQFLMREALKIVQVTFNCDLCACQENPSH